MRAADEVDIPPVGAWIRWITLEFGHEGQVIESSWPSMVVKWLGVDEPQVFPWAHPHFTPLGDMEVIPKPAQAAKIERQQASGVLGVAAAAAALGTTPKRVRQRLRDGTLKGIQRDGKWIEVFLDG